MQKNCEYCGSLFTFQRNTRKYCSDNCKQMAYFTRNGFALANNASTAQATHCLSPIVTVKDVKYLRLNSLKNGKNDDDSTVNESELQKVMEYAKCLISNLRHLSEHQYVERDTFLEFTAAWSQFVRWHLFKRAELQFQSYSFILELQAKLNALAKAHRQSDLIEINLSPQISNNLNDSLDQMQAFRSITFSEIRF